MKIRNNLLILQAVLTTRIAPDREILHKTKVSNHNAKYILLKKTSLRKKHKANFISLQAANVSEPTYSKSYFAILQNLNYNIK